MYLSPSVAPPTNTPPPSPRSYPQRHRRATRRSLSVIPSAHAASIPPPSSCFRLPSSFRGSFKPPRASPFPTPIRNSDVQHPRTSLHAAFTFPCVLTHCVYFSPLSSPSLYLPFLRLALFLHCAHRSPTHTNRRGIRTPSNRRVASVLRALTDFPISILFSRIRRNITARC